MESNKFKKGHTPWNKGIKGFIHNGSFKEGHSQSNTGRTHFKKGNIPWSKYNKELMPKPKNKGLEFRRLNTTVLQKTKINLTKMQCAYLAGFLDSDGNINISRNNGEGSHTWILRISFYNCNYEALNIMKDWIGFGKVLEQKTKGENRKPFFRLVYSSAKAAKIIKRLAPYLLVKKNQAKIVMEFLETFGRNNYEGSSWQGGRKVKKETLQKRKQLKQKLQSLTGTANFLGKNPLL